MRRGAFERAYQTRKTTFRRYRLRFSMLDRFPQNGGRFLVTRETSLEWWEKQRAAYNSFDSALP